MTYRVRRLAAIAAATLTVGALPLINLGTAAQAAGGGCEHEWNPVPPLNLNSAYTCDDITQPDTALSATVTPNAAGWVNTNDVTLTFGVVAAGDPDESSMTLRCSLTGPSQSFAEKDCTSPITLTDLDDSLDAYTFSVHAVDDGGLLELHGDNEVDESDKDITAVNMPAEVVKNDYDESPATLTWKIDTTTPRGLIVGGPYDEITPDFPVLWGSTTTYTLGSTEKAATPVCKLNGVTIACQQGSTVLKGLTTGTKTFTMQLRDAAGNTDAVKSKKFTVPFNIVGSATELQKWKHVTGQAGYFGGDYYESRTKGATLSRQVAFTELRFRIPVGPTLGSFRSRLGTHYFPLVNQYAAQSGMRVVVIRDETQGRMSGQFQIINMGTKPVRIDAIMYR